MKKKLVGVKGLANLMLHNVESDWLNYRKRGIGPEDIPELLRIATDPAQFATAWTNDASIPARHAVRALAQLHALEAVGPLLAFLATCNEHDDDLMAGDLSVVLSRFGLEALPELEAYLANSANDHHPRVVVADAIANMGQLGREQREACVAALSGQLERSWKQEHDPTLNGILIDCLLDLEAVEASPLMEKVFAAGMVDPEIIRDWDEAQAILRGEVDDYDDEEDEDFGDDFEDDFDESGYDEPERGWGERRWGEQPPPLRDWSAPPEKSPKQRAQERAKERKKKKKKK